MALSGEAAPNACAALTNRFAKTCSSRNALALMSGRDLEMRVRRFVWKLSGAPRLHDSSIGLEREIPTGDVFVPRDEAPADRVAGFRRRAGHCRVAVTR